MSSSLKILLIAFFIIFLKSQLSSQDNMLDSLNFEPATEPTHTKQYFGIGIGYTGSFLFSDFKKLNDDIVKKFGLDDLKSPVFLSGIEGFIVTFKIPNLRIGLSGKGGSALSEKTMNIAGTDYKRSVEYKLFLSGLSFEYVFMPFNSVAIIPGFGGGIASLSVEAYQGNKKAWTEINETINENFLNRAEISYWYLQPSVSIEWAVTDYMVLRGNAGYSISLLNTSNWKYNRNAELSGVPPEINSNGLTAQVGIFFGLFNF
ncbi:MAG: hypothetical protein HW421_599 [Ignavibacteria bacterium]|nr:hypothetical protein [Ignavibacteria bacterium]